MIRLLYLAFILSGAAGLIYESTWTRYLGLFVGHDAYAQIVVLVIFLGGMSAGALLVSRWGERLAQPLKGYVAIEFVVGCLGLVFHEVFEFTTGAAYGSLFPALAGSWALTPAKWLLASLLILPQSVLLGATFPLMSAGAMRIAPGRPGRILALLYFANSLGAAVGVIISGFVLVPAAGLPGTLTVAAMLNLVVAVLTIGIVAAARNRGVDVSAGPRPVTATRPSARRITDLSPEGLRRMLLLVSFGTAVASFIYEVDWIRMLSLVLGSATHSFELMLSAFILGLALGAFWIRTRADRLADPVRTLGLVQWTMGLLALATLPLYTASFSWIASLMNTFTHNDAGYTGFTLARYGLCLVIMLPATFCAGMTLPLITRTLMVSGGGERAIGAVYGWNTLGSIAGVALAGLLLLPVLGLKVMLVAGAAMDMAIGVALLALAAPRHPTTRRLAGVTAAAMVVVTVAIGAGVRLDQRLLTSGVFRSGSLSRVNDRNIEFFRDGRTATVAVMRTNATGDRSLVTNGKPDASLSRGWYQACGPDLRPAVLGGDAATQALLPLMALAHAPKARSAAIIGQGSGMSSHFLLGSPLLGAVTTVEIEPEMVEGSRLFYPANRRVFDDPRSHIVIGDAKSYFAAQNARYDLIISEPSNPWVSGVSGLFTVEFYHRIRRYLTPDGVFGQWLHMYELDDGLVLSVLAAIHQSFPAYQVYMVADGDLLVVATNRPTVPPPDWTVVDLPEIGHDLCRFRRLTPDALDAMWLVGRRELTPLLETFGQPNSDYYPVLDLGAERRRFRKDFAGGFRGLSADWYNLLASVGGHRVAQTAEGLPVNPGIPRVTARALATVVQMPERLDRTDSTWVEATGPALTLAQMWQAAIESGKPPRNWRLWVNETMRVEEVRQGGRAGVADTAFYEVAEAFMARHSAPPEVRAVMAFRRGIASWNFREAAAAGDRIVPLALGKKPWLPPDQLRDGLVLAKLHIGDREGARRVYARLASVSTRAPGDLRSRLLESYVGLEEGDGTSTTALR